MKIVPLSDQLLVEPIEERIDAGGLVIPPGKSGEKPARGKVIAAGPGALDRDGKRVTPEVQAGDEILFSKYAPQEFDLEGQKVLLIESKSVLAKIER
jgi:chaperonin GroES